MSSLWPSPDELAHLDDDPAAADYTKWLKGIVNLLDHAMDAEGVDAGVRDRVVSRVMNGAPVPDAEVEHVDTGAPMNGGASVRRTLAEPDTPEQAYEDWWASSDH